MTPSRCTRRRIEPSISISYSRGTDPMWNSPDGPARAARVKGGWMGDIGIFQERHWISLRTVDDRFVILRVGEPLVRTVLTALEDRTRRSVERVR